MVIVPRVKGVTMKRLILVVTAVSVLVLGIISCTPAYEADTDTPAYKATEVIAVAQAKYPVCFRTYHPEETVPSSISVEYIGESCWEIVISCPSSGYRLSAYSSSQTLWFYETDGSFSFTRPY